jgi:hypothetical protein
MSEQGWRATRQAWVDGVIAFYPGTPKQSYIKPWNEIDKWEQQAVKMLYSHIRAIILPTIQAGKEIPLEHGGYLVCSIWNVLVLQLLDNPKPSYIKHFDQLDNWQQRTDIKMFEAIRDSVLQETRIEA